MDSCFASNINRNRHVISKYLNKKICNYSDISKNLRSITAADINKGGFTITEPGYYQLEEDIVHSFFKENDNENNISRQLRCLQRCIQVVKSTCEELKAGTYIYEKKEKDLFSQSNFESSPYRWVETNNEITIEKYGKKMNNVCFSFDPESTNSCILDENMSFSVLNPMYIGGANIREATAAIKIACDNVILDLNGHSISMSKRFYCEQRVYSIIQINRLVFLNSGSGFEPGPQVEQPGCTNVAIINGSLGNSSHFGIHGTNSSQVICKNLNIHDFNVAGIWINNGHQIIIEDCNIHGNVNNVMPIMELRAFKTTGTGKKGIADANKWGIFLNDRSEQNQRMFATESHPLLEDEPPHDGVDAADGSKGKNRMLAGPRGSIIRNCNIGEIKTNMVQGRVVARRNQKGKLVPVLFSIRQGAHTGMKAAPQEIINSMNDGYAHFKNRYNPKYNELYKSYRITSNYGIDINGNKVETGLDGKIIIGQLKVYKKLDEHPTLVGGDETIIVDKFVILDNGCLKVCNLANDSKKYDVIIECDSYERIADETLCSPRWEFTFGIERQTEEGNFSNVILNQDNTPVFKNIIRDWNSQVEIVGPRDNECRFKLASRCLQKDLRKSNYGSYPKLCIPNNNETDLNDRNANTFFKFQYEKVIDEEDPDHAKLDFLWVEDNYGIDNLSEHANKKGSELLKVTSFDKSGRILNKNSLNMDGEEFTPYPGSYITILQGNHTGYTAKERMENKCIKQNKNLQTLSAKIVETIPLINQMLDGREKDPECGGIDTDGKNGIDIGGHNMIGAFGLMLERSWGGLYENIQISGTMTLNGEGGWGENWWGVMANNSGFNIFKNINVQNIPGNPAVVFGFHLHNGSTANIVENVNVQGANSPGESYGLVVDRASESNVFRNCLVGEVFGREAALGYVVRSKNNTFEDCKATRICLILNDNEPHAGDMLASGFCLDNDDEETHTLTGWNTLRRCSVDNVRTMMDKELNMERGNDLEDSIKDSEKNNYVYKFGMLKEIIRRDRGSNSKVNMDMILAGRPNIITQANLLNTYSTGIVIVHQSHNIVDNCCIENVSGWGTCSGILVTDKLLPDNHPSLNKKNQIIGNNVNNIVSYNPGCIFKEGDDLKKINLLVHDHVHSVWVKEKLMLNPNHKDYKETLINDPELLEQFLNPHVCGIGDLRLDQRNNFTPFFEKQKTNLSINDTLALFVSDTLCKSNSCINCYNYWTNIHNSYDFHYLNLPEDGYLSKDTIALLDKLSQKEITDVEMNILRSSLKKNKNEGLYCTKDIDVCDIESIGSANKNMNVSITSSYQNIHKDGALNLNSNALDFMLTQDYNMILEEQKSVIKLLRKTNTDNLWVDVTRLPDSHAEVEALALQAEIDAGLFEEESDHGCQNENIDLVKHL